MGILCVFCVYDTIGNRCFEKTSFIVSKNGKCLSDVFSAVSVEIGKICKNIDHLFLFHCINSCWVPWPMFDHSA